MNHNNGQSLSKISSEPKSVSPNTMDNCSAYEFQTWLTNTQTTTLDIDKGLNLDWLTELKQAFQSAKIFIKQSANNLQM